MGHREMPGFSWQGVVPAEANLPTAGNVEGDFRFALSEATLHYWKSGAWNEFSGGGGGGGSPGGSTTEIQYNDAGSFAGWNQFVIADHILHGAGTLSTQWINYNNANNGIEIGKAYWTVGTGCRTAMFMRGDSDPSTQYVEIAVDSNDIGGYRRRKNFYLGDMNWDYHQALLNDIGFRFSIATVSGVHRFDLSLRGDSHARPGQMDFVYNNNGGSDVILGTWGTEGTLYMRQIGKGVSIRQGSGTLCGNATLVAGTVTVTNTNITADSVIKLNHKTPGGTLGFLSYTLSAGASFTINSTSSSDTSDVSYEITQTHA